MYQLKNPEIYGNDLLSEVIRYSHQVGSIAEKEDYDIIHCHDWLTFPAGIRVKKVAERRGKAGGKMLPGKTRLPGAQAVAAGS